jgi:hypothetical protein
VAWRGLMRRRDDAQRTCSAGAARRVLDAASHFFEPARSLKSSTDVPLSAVCYLLHDVESLLRTGASPHTSSCSLLAGSLKGTSTVDLLLAVQSGSTHATAKNEPARSRSVLLGYWAAGLLSAAPYDVGQRVNAFATH